MPAKPGAMSDHAKQEVDACLLVTMPRSTHGLCVLQEFAAGPVEPLVTGSAGGAHLVNVKFLCRVNQQRFKECNLTNSLVRFGCRGLAPNFTALDTSIARRSATFWQWQCHCRRCMYVCCMYVCLMSWGPTEGQQTKFCLCKFMQSKHCSLVKNSS